MTKKGITRDIPASLAAFDALPPSAFVRLPTVCALFGIGPATVWRWAEAGKIPRATKIGKRISGWRVGEIRHALQTIGQGE